MFINFKDHIPEDQTMKIKNTSTTVRKPYNALIYILFVYTATHYSAS